MEENLTLLEAFKAMYTFLEHYYFQVNKPDEIGTLLGDLRILHDEKPLDPTAWNDWLIAVRKVLDAENPEPKNGLG